MALASTYFDNFDPCCRPNGLKVEEKIFWVSDQGLAMYSPVFKAMFYGVFTYPQNQILPLPDKKAEDILEMLLCLFPIGRTMKEVDSENVDILLTLADEYQIAFLKRECQKFLTAKILTIHGKHDDLWLVLSVASKHHLIDTMDECAKKCAMYTLDEAMRFMGELPPVAIALVALYAWKAVTPGVHVAGSHDAAWQHCYKCGVQYFYTCANCKQKYCAECSSRSCRSVNLESLNKLVEKMKLDS